MPIIDKSSLQSNLETLISNIDNSTCIKDILLSADAHHRISENFSTGVLYTCELPSTTSSCVACGHLIFVDEVNKHLVAGPFGWYDLNGTLVRQDADMHEVYGWGINSILPTQYFSSGNPAVSPIQEVEGFKNWIKISNTVNGAGIIGDIDNQCGDLYWWGKYGGGAIAYSDNGFAAFQPVKVDTGFSDWTDVSIGECVGVALRANGTVWTWGLNNYGQLGINSSGYYTSKSSPVSVVGGFTDWCQVSTSAQGCHVAAVRANGTLWTWGRNCADGRLGNNSNYNQSSPVSVVGGFTDWCQVSAGSYHTAAVRENGTLWTWGRESYGRLGNNEGGPYTAKSSPVSVVGGFTDWCQVSAGSYHTAAVRENGTLWTWGRNHQGQLGDETVYCRSSPVSVVGGFTDWCQVSVSDWHHNVALRSNGTAWSWGNNNFAQLGDGTKYGQSSPVSVVGGFTDWCQVSAGPFKSSGIRIVSN